MQLLLVSVQLLLDSVQLLLFVCSYCGHGGGSRFISGDTLQSWHCRACVLLMGCSSGKLAVHGSLEASGLMLNYFLAGW